MAQVDAAALGLRAGGATDGGAGWRRCRRGRIDGHICVCGAYEFDWSWESVEYLCRRY